MDYLQKLYSIFAEIIREYCDFFDEAPVIANFIITKDLSQEYAKLRPDLISSNLIDIDEINNNNGMAVPPQSEGDFTILLNQEYLLKECQNNSINWMGTVAHEITHVKDFLKYKLISNYTFDEMLDYEKNIVFVNWTEFNAKVKGYLFLRNKVFDNIYDRKQVNDIKNTELPILLNNMIKEYSETTNANRQIYVVSHFLAHVYVWQKLFPLDFSDDSLEQLFINNDWMKELYYFFSENRDLEMAISNTERFKEILRMNFRGI